MAAGELAIGLGRKGWDRMERFWGGATAARHGHGHTSSPSFDSRGGVLVPPGGGRGVVGTASGSGARMSGTDPTSMMDNMTNGSSPNLPPPLRAARPRASGLVFGQRLSSAVNETAVETSLSSEGGKEKAWVDTKGRMRGVGCPALVVRCIQHLELWGVEEEGIFRSVRAVFFMRGQLQ